MFAFIFAFLSLLDAASCEGLLAVTIGENVTLDCHSSQKGSVGQLVWSRADLPEDKLVFFYRRNSVVTSYQEPRFVGRVTLKDPKMADGDASLVLNNVTLSDTGTYECRLGLSGARRRKRNAPHLSSVRLVVSNPGPSERHSGEEGGEVGGDEDAGRRRHIISAVSVIGAVIAVMAIGFAGRRGNGRGSVGAHDRAALEPDEAEAGLAASTDGN